MDVEAVVLEDLLAGRAPGEFVAHWQRVVRARLRLLQRIARRG